MTYPYHTFFHTYGLSSCNTHLLTLCYEVEITESPSETVKTVGIDLRCNTVVSKTQQYLLRNTSQIAIGTLLWITKCNWITCASQLRTVARTSCTLHWTQSLSLEVGTYLWKWEPILSYLRLGQVGLGSWTLPWTSHLNNRLIPKVVFFVLGTEGLELWELVIRTQNNLSNRLIFYC